jgi:hypothetical protein
LLTVASVNDASARDEGRSVQVTSCVRRLLGGRDGRDDRERAASRSQVLVEVAGR